MKKILILTAGFGEGHNSAARGIREGLLQIAPEAQTDIRDIFAETYGPLNELTRRVYLGAINRAPEAWRLLYRWIDRRRDYRDSLGWLLPARRKLASIIEREPPDVIISVYPAYPHLLDMIAGPASGLPPKRIVVITDSITVNAIWFRCSADSFLLANEQTADVLAQAGVRRDLLRVFGFPVDPRFADLELRALRPSGPPWKILYMINSRQGPAPNLTRRLLMLPQTQLTITVGRDEKLRRDIEKVRARSGRMFEIVGWTTQLPHLLSSHHLLISKAGGATVQETIAAGCPMIINQIVPGQEQGNAQLIVDTKSGMIAASTDDVFAALERAIADDAKLLREWSTNIVRISRPDAALRIARFLMSI